MYAGPVGWFSGGESEFAVGIRSALVEKVSQIKPIIVFYLSFDIMVTAFRTYYNISTSY